MASSIQDSLNTDIALVNEYFRNGQHTPVYVNSLLRLLQCMIFRNPGHALIVPYVLWGKAARFCGLEAYDQKQLAAILLRYSAMKTAFSDLAERDVPCLFFDRVGAIENGRYTASARRRMRRKYSFPKMSRQPKRYASDFSELLGDLYSPEYVCALKKVPQIIACGQRYTHVDAQTELINVIAGKRYVPNQPENPRLCIHMYGRCGVFGYAVEDRHALPAQLQQKLHEAGIADVMVENHGLWGGDDDCIATNFLADYPGFGSKDIVIFYMQSFGRFEMPAYEHQHLRRYSLNDYFYADPASRNCFYDRPGHMTHMGYDIIAGGVLEQLKKQSLLARQPQPEASPAAKGAQNAYPKEFLDALQAYLTDIADQYPQAVGQSTGAIVMNCNPFTRGHRYLIEYAAQRVGRLFVFVLQEDRSFFKFADRLAMVERGTADIANVIVLPSREFMISTMTFPEYFIKDYAQSIEIDTSGDLLIFSQHIAPALGISVRFAGEEPLDAVTRAYNRRMRELLPAYGIRFDEIPRLRTEDKAIVSASEVRKLLQDGRYEELKKYVPDTTYTYLCNMHAGALEGGNP